MAKLFVFAIGGSGSRVIKALTMLLASGVKIENTETVIPIIIDPDVANGDLTRTEEVIRLYRSIYKKSTSNKSFFFNTPINSLDEMKESEDDNGTPIVAEHFRYEIEGVKDSRFGDFIGYSEMDKHNKALTSLLFSRDNLEADMDMGFKGNPNIGSVVINKFRNSSFFREFAQSLGENDRIFIISSIFGGTGAAGFPIILKNIRGAQPPIPNHINMQNAKIGAVTILPYFSVNDTDSTTKIDSNTFISKTKAALNYYARNISGNNSLDALYYIGDDFTDNRVEGADGAAEQKNNAHFIELASALAIIDFMSRGDEDFGVANGKVISPMYFEYGLKNPTNKIEFKDLALTSYKLIANPLTQYTLFEIFFEKYLDETSDKIYATNGNNKLQKQFLDKRFVDDLNRFNRHFRDWITEMSKTTVSFTPLNINVKRADILNLVKGSPEPTSPYPWKIQGLEFYLNELAKSEHHSKEKFDALADTNKKLMATFAHATQSIVTQKIRL